MSVPTLVCFSMIPQTRNLAVASSMFLLGDLLRLPRRN
jgi:hypothetical protein